MTVGDETLVADAGTLVWAPAGVPHGVDEALERTVLAGFHGAAAGLTQPGRAPKVRPTPSFTAGQP